MQYKYDIFISYKRKSLATANNLYYRLTTRGYFTFFDLEEMRRDNFNTQLLQYIENAKDIFVILEEGSLDGCKLDDWEKKDWFCHEIAYALEKKKNIIPMMIGGFEMPPEDFFPEKLKEFHLKNGPEFNYSFFEAYLDKLIEKGYLNSKPNLQEQATSVFKFYSNENCFVFKEGKLVCSLDGMSDEPYYLPVPRKGDYRFECVNSITNEKRQIKEHIDSEEEKEVDIQWKDHKSFNPDNIWNDPIKVSGDVFPVKLGNVTFNMIRVEGGRKMIGATPEQGDDIENNERPAHSIHLMTFYIGEFPITQNIWELVMGYNKSHFRDKEYEIMNKHKDRLKAILDCLGEGNDLTYKKLRTIRNHLAHDSSYLREVAERNGGRPIPYDSFIFLERFLKYESSDLSHYPVENVTHDEALEFTKRLSKMTNISFSLPTEEEWEYAARGGQKGKGFKYSGDNDIDLVAWYRGNANGSTHPVGEKMPNELGIFDMSGNVWEWTNTPAHSYENSIELEGDIFIRRGGSWWHEDKNCRVSRRYASDHTKKTSGLGLRVVIRNNIK